MTGFHSHYEVAKGKYKGMYAKNYTTGVWHLPDSISPDLACVIDGCTVYNHGQPVSSGNKMNWKTSIDIPGIDKVTVSTPLPTGGTTPVTSAIKTGWVQTGDKWQYYDKNGNQFFGWLQKDNKWYYIGKAGYMLTGWQEIEYKGSKRWFWFDSKGVMATGWKEIDNEWYYMDKNGIMQTGWIMDGDYHYYLNSKGKMLRAGTFTISNKDYTFDKSGHWIKDVPQQEDAPKQEEPKEEECQVLDIKNEDSGDERILGCDISAHQPADFDFEPYDFVILRCAWGTNTDDKFNMYADKLEEMGKPYGVYIYSYALTAEDGFDEAEYVLDLIKDRKIDCGVWYDTEWDNYRKQHGAFTQDIQMGSIDNFCTTVKEAGYYVGVYTAPAFVNQYIPEIKWPTWLAWWGVDKSRLDSLSYADKIVMHQYQGDPLDLDELLIPLDTFKDSCNCDCDCCKAGKCKK